MWLLFYTKKEKNQSQVSLPSYQNITEETVIEAQPSGSKKGQKGQEIGEQVPEVICGLL